MLRWREREGAWFAAALALCSVLFALWPQIDLRVAAALRGPEGFVGNGWLPVRVVYETVP